MTDSIDRPEALRVAILGALAALSQNATLPADIAAARKWLADAIDADDSARLDARLAELMPEWSALVADLIPSIDDEYRAYECDHGAESCADADCMPSMLLTVGSDDELDSWGYQTGDNSYTGGAYGSPHWAVVAVYRDSVPADVAAEIADQLGELIAS